MGQTYCLYGSTQAFADVVTYYRTVLKDRGELVFDAPATHMFEVGKFKETEVAFPPGVTVKDYTWSGSPGYTNPKPGATPAFFPTVIQIVPPPPAPSGDTFRVHTATHESGRRRLLLSRIFRRMKHLVISGTQQDRWSRLHAFLGTVMRARASIRPRTIWPNDASSMVG
jgi:hypothetical protein